MVQRALAPVQFRPPMECRPVAELPGGDLWQYELKFDGYRAQAIKSEGEVHLFSRRGKDFDAIYPQVVADLATVRGVKQFVPDGELVAVDEQGPSFIRTDAANSQQTRAGAVLHFRLSKFVRLREDGDVRAQ